VTALTRPNDRQRTDPPRTPSPYQVVDDGPAGLEVVAIVLEAEGASVTAADSAASAREGIRAVVVGEPPS
jgi:hypothetical protein